MSIFRRSSRKHRFISHTIHVPKCIAPQLVSLADRLFADDSDGDAFQTALLPFFVTERPRIAILKGNEIWFHLEGPLHDCGGRTFPLGAQVFVDHRGCLQLGPVDAGDLHARLRKAIDEAAFNWLIEHDLLDQCEPLRSRCNRPIDDEVALRQMADAAALIHPEAEPSDA